MIAKPVATEAQTKFISDLIAQRALTPEQRTAAEAEVKGTITKERASIIISFLKALPYAPKAPAVSAVASTLTDIPKSKYAFNTVDMIGLTSVDPDGTDTLFFEVREYKGTTYMRRLIGAPGDFLKVRMSRNDEKIIAARIAEDPKGAAKHFADKFSCCAVCAAPLTDQTSRDLGLGPICRNRF